MAIEIATEQSVKSINTPISTKQTLLEWAISSGEIGAEVIRGFIASEDNKNSQRRSNNTRYANLTADLLPYDFTGNCIWECSQGHRQVDKIQNRIKKINKVLLDNTISKTKNSKIKPIEPRDKICMECKRIRAELARFKHIEKKYKSNSEIAHILRNNFEMRLIINKINLEQVSLGDYSTIKLFYNISNLLSNKQNTELMKRKAFIKLNTNQNTELTLLDCYKAYDIVSPFICDIYLKNKFETRLVYYFDNPEHFLINKGWIQYLKLTSNYIISCIIGSQETIVNI